ncbi:class II aldolase/adducin family protein [Caballeronia sp. GAFFF1]|uniref:class II aldolase/adducin family protein n=1 Tax=Caballeronia sp. GAFFF1 TaxID=2921779 RepID=UPI0032EF8CF0
MNVALPTSSSRPHRPFRRDEECNRQVAARQVRDGLRLAEIALSHRQAFSAPADIATPLSWTSQASLKSFGRIAVDDEYNGLALAPGEGDRIASIMGNVSIAFLRNHGVIVVGASIGEAWDDLYYLERACPSEYMARCTQGRLSRVAEETATRPSKQWSSFGPVAGRLHLASIKRHLDRLAVDYAA